VVQASSSSGCCLHCIAPDHCDEFSKHTLIQTSALYTKPLFQRRSPFYTDCISAEHAFGVREVAAGIRGPFSGLVDPSMSKWPLGKHWLCAKRLDGPSHQEVRSTSRKARGGSSGISIDYIFCTLTASMMSTFANTSASSPVFGQLCVCYVARSQSTVLSEVKPLPPHLMCKGCS
jgi:hypothetical protein